MIIGIICGVVFILLAYLVKKYPDLIAGYNTMSKKRKEKVDIKGLEKFLFKSFISIGGVMILVSLVLHWFDFDMYIPAAFIGVMFLGCIIILIIAQKYDHNPRKAYNKVLLVVIALILLGIGGFSIKRALPKDSPKEQTADSRGYIVAP